MLKLRRLPSLHAISSRLLATAKFTEESAKVISRISKKPTELWSLYNEVVYEPRDPLVHGPEVTRRPIEFTHQKTDLTISRKRATLLAHMISGMSISEALLQLSYKEGVTSRIFERLLVEAIELGVKEHGVEFRTRLFVETCRVLRGTSVKRLYKGLRTSLTQKPCMLTSVFLRLRESHETKSALSYHRNNVPDAWVPRPNCPAEGSRGWGSTEDMVLEELARMRSRKIKGGL